MRPQSSKKQWIVQGPSSCSLTVSLLDSACLFVICRVLVESGVGFDSPTHILVLDEVGEFVWPLIRVVVLAGWNLRVAVLACGKCPCVGGSSSGRRLRGCMTRLAEWNFVVDPPCQPFGSSVF